MHCSYDEEMWEHFEEYPDLAFGLRRIRVGIRRDWRRFDGKGLMPLQPMLRSIEELMKETGYTMP